MKTLREWIQKDYYLDEKDLKRLSKHLDVAIKQEFRYGGWVTLGGSQKHVCWWVLLENGHAVGFNENPALGWSYPSFKPKRDKVEAAIAYDIKTRSGFDAAS